MEQRRINVVFYELFISAELLRTQGAHPANIRQRARPGLLCASDRGAKRQAAFLANFALTLAQRARCAAAIRARAAADSLRRGLSRKPADALLRPLLLPLMCPRAAIALSRRSSSRDTRARSRRS